MTTRQSRVRGLVYSRTWPHRHFEPPAVSGRQSRSAPIMWKRAAARSSGGRVAEPQTVAQLASEGPDAEAMPGVLSQPPRFFSYDDSTSFSCFCKGWLVIDYIKQRRRSIMLGGGGCVVGCGIWDVGYERGPACASARGRLLSLGRISVVGQSHQYPLRGGCRRISPSLS
jgi:hypothetical protein